MATSAEAVSQGPTIASAAVRALHLHSGNMIGGIESALHTMAEFSPTCPEFRQEIALVFDGRFAESLRSAGISVHPLPEVQLRNPLSVVRARRELDRLLQPAHFDVVISNSPWCQVVFGPVFQRARVPVVFWMHGAFDGHWLQKLASRHVPDFVICNSEYTQSTLARVYPDVASSIVHYPVPPVTTTSTREQLRCDLGVAPETVVILMASRMEHWKGHFNLLHAAAQLNTNTNWLIWIAGAPQASDEQHYYQSVVNEVRRNQLESRVRFLGQRSDVSSLMRAADVFCQPNAAPEPFGVAFVEALQAGVPPVTFSMGGPREILSEDSGILVQPGDIVGLSRALATLIDDAGLREGFRDACIARAKQLCDPAQQVRRIYATVSSVVQKKKGAAS